MTSAGLVSEALTDWYPIETNEMINANKVVIKNIQTLELNGKTDSVNLIRLTLT